MPVDAIVHLDRLRCLEEVGHSEPYVWTLLIWVDDTTINSGQLVGSSGLGNIRGSRAIIKEGIEEGEQVPMPPQQRSLFHRFEDDLLVGRIGIVVLMFEADETPTDAVRAAYSAFKREFPRALADYLREHRLQPPETDAQREEIASKVRPKVRKAAENALSTWEKAQIALGTLNLDDSLGVDSWFTTVDPREPGPDEFTLGFEKETEIRPPFGAPLTIHRHYEIDGRFELREPPEPEVCEAEIERVKRARMRVDGLQSQIRQLQKELHEAPPSGKAAILRAIRRLREVEVPAAAAALEAEQRVLARCRANASSR